MYGTGEKRADAAAASVCAHSRTEEHPRVALAKALVSSVGRMPVLWAKSGEVILKQGGTTGNNTSSLNVGSGIFII
jgi:hypothetical protein